MTVTRADRQALGGAPAETGTPKGSGYMWSMEFEKMLRKHCCFLTAETALDPDAPMTHLGMDSMAIVSFLMDLEETFGFEFSEEQMTPEMFATPGTLWTALEGYFVSLF